MISTWVIYCEEMLERRCVTEAHLLTAGVSPHWWRGVHGRTWGIEPALPGHRLSPGGLGNLLSHWSLWQHLHHAKISTALIFEDDVVLREDFLNRLYSALVALPADWQFVYVGWQDRPALPRQLINSYVQKLLYPFGTFAYLVRDQALPILLDGMARGKEPIDIQLFEVLPKLCVYCLTTPLVVDRTQALHEWRPSLE